MNKIISTDLEHILNHTRSLWIDIKDKTILITGGTGFFGKWLLQSFVYCNEALNLNACAIVLSRDPEAFLKAHPYFNINCIEFIKGDIKSFTFPHTPIHYIIHAATEASVTLNLANPFLMFDTIVEGTKHVLELARSKNVTAVLHTSSGAVYGDQPPEMYALTEDFKGSPDIYSTNAAYGEGKRVAEMLSNFYHKNYGVKSTIARCFAFIGPYLPLDGHFAAGNFINNILNNQDIEIMGDGTTYRSYLYSADLVIWLWHILLRGEACRPYNVGADTAVSIEELADMIACSSNGNSIVKIAMPKTGKPPLRYVPAIERARKELQLEITVTLQQAIDKTIQYYTADD